MIAAKRPSTPASDLPPLPERAAVWLLCLAAIVGPLALGSTGPLARLGLEVLTALAAVLWAVSGKRMARSLILPVSIPGLMLLQLVPLPEGILLNVAPVSAGRWKVAQEGMAGGWAPISVAPAVTAAAIQRLLLGLATIATVVDLSRKGIYRRWLYTSLAVSGVLIWVAGLGFPVNVKDRLVLGFFKANGPIEFWKTTERGPLQTAGFSFLDWVTVGSQRYQADGSLAGDGFGSYIYGNHFANALCLTLPAVWMLWLFYTKNRLPLVVRYALLITAMAAAIGTTAAMVSSRAGTASLILAAVVYLSLIAESRGLRWAAGSAAAMMTAGLLCFVAIFQGPLSAIARNMPAALEGAIAQIFVDTRVVAAHMAGRMFLASPVLGTGLGAYGDLYPGFARVDHVLYFAHNDYAQLLAESGFLGGASIVWAAWALGTRFYRFCKERQPANRLIDSAAWAALAGAAAHSVFDWNMHAPANAFLACIVFGLCMTSVAPAKAIAATSRLSLFRKLSKVVFVIACLQALPFLARAAFSDRAMDELRRATTAARIAEKDPNKPSAAPALGAAVESGERAAQYDPANWRLAVLLGQASMHLAAQPQAIDAAEARRRAADKWFKAALSNSAATRGLPQAPSAPTR
jgi:O-antigen ligase